MKQNSSVVKSQGESISGKLFLSGQGPLLALMILLSLLFSPGLLLAQEFDPRSLDRVGAGRPIESRHARALKLVELGKRGFHGIEG